LVSGSRLSKPIVQKIAAYLDAIATSFGGDVDYAMLAKLYGPSPEGERHYSPAQCTRIVKHRIERLASPIAFGK
jgi:hypothetical protein